MPSAATPRSRPLPARLLDAATAALWLVLAAGAACWALVSNDLWPLRTEGRPASAVYELNATLGRWLLVHGEIEARPPPPPPREALTAEEAATVERALRSNPRFQGRERLAVTGRPTALQLRNSALQAAAPSIDVSVGGGAGGGSGGGGGGGGGGGRRG